MNVQRVIELATTEEQRQLLDLLLEYRMGDDDTVERIVSNILNQEEARGLIDSVLNKWM